MPELDEVHLDDLWLEQDGTSSHAANEIINFINETFDERSI